VMTPRSSCPGGESTPLWGANLRLIYEINNVTQTCPRSPEAPRGDQPHLGQSLQGSASGSRGHFRKAQVGHFWRAPKWSGGDCVVLYDWGKSFGG
jgi:hypothetical protein